MRRSIAHGAPETLGRQIGMSTSSTQRIGYRSLQAVFDLRAVARTASPHIAERIAAGSDGAVSPDDFVALIGAGGCVLTTAADVAMHRGLVIAATVPEDAETFRVATAVLLADRLQRGAGTDDLFWHWDAFQERYLEFVPTERAAILHGYERANFEGLVNLYDPPGGPAMASRTRANILQRLTTISDSAESQYFARTIGGVLDSQAATGHAAALWADARAEIFALPQQDCRMILAALRHLYETRRDFEPFRNETFDPADPDAPVLPYGV